MITPEERDRLRELRLAGYDDYVARKVYQATAIDKFPSILDALDQKDAELDRLRAALAEIESGSCDNCNRAKLARKALETP